MITNDLQRNQKPASFDFHTVKYYGQRENRRGSMQSTISKETAWKATNVQFLYRHRNGRYYVRTLGVGNQKWTSLKTSLLSVAKNRMKEHVDAAERQKTAGLPADAAGRLTFGKAMQDYRVRLAVADMRPNTKAYCEAGLKLVLKSWDGVEILNVRRITSRMVEECTGWP